MVAPAPDRATADRRRRPSRWLKPAVFIVALTPALKIGADALFGRLGANPIAEMLNRLGWWTLVLLVATLACSPLKALAGFTAPLRVRRMLGLFAFAYGTLHLVTYAGLDQVFDVAAVIEDIAKRPFITVGFGSLLVLVPLAATSTDAMVRRLGYVRWKRLHRLVYLAAAGGVVHFVWRVKADLREPLVFAGVVAALFAVRVGVWLKRRAPIPTPRFPSGQGGREG